MINTVDMSGQDDKRLEEQANKLASELPGGLSHILVDLEYAPRVVREVTIGLLPFGHRALLEATGIAVVQNSRYSLTNVGEQVIEVCALAKEPST